MSMFYIFEDNEMDLLSRLFRASYSNETCNKFVYTSGVGTILRKINTYLDIDDVAVFMDMLPDNVNCSYIYKRLRTISKTSKHRLIIFPIVCSEYYMIKYLYDYTKYISSHKDVDICLNKGDYRKSSVYAYKGKVCKNFESYCKVILRKYTINCIKHTRLVGDTENSMYGLYYTNDCKCSSSLDNM